MNMVGILLNFTRASVKEGLLGIHLSSCSRMLPYFMKYNHLNYAKWDAVYYAEMKNLPEPIVEKFQIGNFMIKRSDNASNQDDLD